MSLTYKRGFHILAVLKRKFLSNKNKFNEEVKQ